MGVGEVHLRRSEDGHVVHLFIVIKLQDVLKRLSASDCLRVPDNFGLSRIQGFLSTINNGYIN